VKLDEAEDFDKLLMSNSKYGTDPVEPIAEDVKRDIESSSNMVKLDVGHKYILNGDKSHELFAVVDAKSYVKDHHLG